MGDTSGKKEINGGIEEIAEESGGGDFIWSWIVLLTLAHTAHYSKAGGGCDVERSTFKKKCFCYYNRYVMIKQVKPR